MFLFRRTENLLLTNQFDTNFDAQQLVGGITAHKIIFRHHTQHSTNVIRLLGNTDQTVVLLHNSPFNLQVWYPLMAHVQQLYSLGNKIPTLICYDLVGEGTAWMPVPENYNDTNPQNLLWSYEELVDDLHKIFTDFVKEDTITLVGYGSGGDIAQAFALKHPQLIDRLVVLGAPIGPMETGIPENIQYLVDWINKNPLVTYLAMEESFVQWNMCLWFENNNPIQCPYPQNRIDTSNSFNTTEYLKALEMFRLASCTTFLQMEKLSNITDFREQWAAINVSFPISFLIPNNDHYINLPQMQQDFNVIRNASPNAQLLVTRGKHGFPLAEPEYVYGIISGADLSMNPLTVEIVQ